MSEFQDEQLALALKMSEKEAQEKEKMIEEEQRLIAQALKESLEEHEQRRSRKLTPLEQQESLAIKISDQIESVQQKPTALQDPAFQIESINSITNPVSLYESLKKITKLYIKKSPKRAISFGAPLTKEAPTNCQARHKN